MSADATTAGWWLKQTGGITSVGGAYISDLGTPGSQSSFPSVYRLYALNADGRFAVGLYRQEPVENDPSGRLCRLDTKTGEIVPFLAGLEWKLWDARPISSPPPLSAEMEGSSRLNRRRVHW